jgi:hypothetical protein
MRTHYVLREHGVGANPYADRNGRFDRQRAHRSYRVFVMLTGIEAALYGCRRVPCTLL